MWLILLLLLHFSVSGKLLHFIKLNALSNWGIDRFLRTVVFNDLYTHTIQLTSLGLDKSLCFCFCLYDLNILGTAVIKVWLLYHAGDLVEAVVPFMGESITDGTLAQFLKSMLLADASYRVLITCLWLTLWKVQKFYAFKILSCYIICRTRWQSSSWWAHCSNWNW